MNVSPATADAAPVYVFINPYIPVSPVLHHTGALAPAKASDVFAVNLPYLSIGQWMNFLPV